MGEARAGAANADLGVVGLQALGPAGAWVTLQHGEKVASGSDQSSSATARRGQKPGNRGHLTEHFQS